MYFYTLVKKTLFGEWIVIKIWLLNRMTYIFAIKLTKVFISYPSFRFKPLEANQVVKIVEFRSNCVLYLAVL